METTVNGVRVYSGLNLAGHILPIADNTYDLGSAALSWRNLYVDTLIYATAVSGNWSPSAASTYTLGTTSAEWQGLYLGDDAPVYLGLGQEFQILKETADADAVALAFVAPEGGAANVPAFIFGDASILNANLGWFNGLTEPSLVVVNDAQDAYVRIDAGDDAVAGSQGIYFKAAADEDIEIINLSVTGTPRIFWDESESAFSFPGLTMTGNIDLNAYDLLHVDSIYGSTAILPVRIGDATTALSGATTEDSLLVTGNLDVKGISYLDSNLALKSTVTFGPQIGNDVYLKGQATDNGVTGVEIWRMISGADPHFRIGRDDTGVALNAVTDMLVLLAGGGTGNAAANFGLGISVLLANGASENEERASIDFDLTTATDGSEDSQIAFSTMTSGGMVTPLVIGDTGSSTRVAHGIGLHTDVVTADHATHAALNAAGLTDNAILWQQPAGSVLKHIKCVLTEQFVAAGLTDFDFTIGDGGDADGIIAPGAMNGTSDAVNTAWKTHGAYWDSAAEGGQGFYQHAAVDWYLYATAVGANLNTLTAGTLTFYITYELGQ